MKSIAKNDDGFGRFANASFKVVIGGVELNFSGGPYRVAARFKEEWPDAFLVKMASEQPGQSDVAVPVQDFGTPDPAALRAAVGWAIRAAFDGKPVFVGCGAGWGRTGLFLAVVLKVLLPRLKGQEQIVKELRRIYIPQAVETPGQRALLDSIDVSGLRRMVFRLWLRAKIRQVVGRFFWTRRG